MNLVNNRFNAKSRAFESDINAIKDTILRISRLIEDFPEILEMDINPFFVFDKGNGISAVDVKITIAPEE